MPCFIFNLVKSRSAFRYTLDYMKLHEGLNNRESEQGVEPTKYREMVATAEGDNSPLD